MTTAWQRFRTAIFAWLVGRDVSDSAVTFATAIVVGVGAGLGSTAFRWFIGAIQSLGYGPVSDVLAFGPQGGARLLIVPAIGGLIVGPLVYFGAREAKGHGVPEVMEAVALRGGRIRRRVALVKILASGVCIGTGGSVGREGPIVQIGSAIGSSVGQAFNFSSDRLRSLVACGAAAGIAATFNAPIAGAIFAIEVILGQFHTLYFAAVVIAAVVADVVALFFTDEIRAFNVPEYSLGSPWELLFYALLGALAAVGAFVYSRGLYLVEDVWDRLPVVEWVKPAIGGVALGVIGLLSFKTDGFPRVFGVGYESISDALLGNLAFQTAALLLLLKLLATWTTLGSGGSGGVFAPALFLGAMLGSAFGTGVGTLFPGIASPSGAYALVGMAAFFSGAAHAPVTSILILFEMTGDYRIILPLMLATVVSTLLSSLFGRESIYTLKLARRGVFLDRGRDVEVLAATSVGELMSTDIEAVEGTLPAVELAAEFSRANARALPVVDAQGELIGMVSVSDLDRAVEEGRFEGATVADLATVDELEVSYVDESMGQALRRFGIRDVNRLPVVQRGSKVPVGVIRRNDLLRAYDQALSRRGQELHKAEHLGLGQVEDLTLLRIRVRRGAPSVGRSVSEIPLPGDALMVSLRRGDEQHVVRGSTVVQEGDVVTVVTKRASVLETRRQVGG